MLSVLLKKAFTKLAIKMPIASGVIKSSGKFKFLKPLISKSKKALLISSLFIPFSSTSNLKASKHSSILFFTSSSTLKGTSFKK